MPEIVAFLTTASLGGKTRFSWSTDSIALDIYKLLSALIDYWTVEHEPARPATPKYRLPSITLRDPSMGGVPGTAAHTIASAAASVLRCLVRRLDGGNLTPLLQGSKRWPNLHQ